MTGDDMDHTPPQPQPEQPETQPQEAQAEGGTDSTTPDARRSRTLSAAQSALGRLSESPATVDAHHESLHAPVWAGEGKGDEGKKPHAYLPPPSQRGGKAEDDTWWMRRPRAASQQGPEQQQEQEQGNGDNDDEEDESLVARLKQHKARAAAAAATTSAAALSSTDTHEQQQQDTTSTIPTTEEAAEQAHDKQLPPHIPITTTTYIVSVTPWGLQPQDQPGGCSLFRCGPSPSTDTGAPSSSFMSYRIHITSQGQGQGQGQGQPNGEGGKACVKRYSEIRALHELWLSRGLIPAASPARRLFPPKAAPPLSSAGAASLARARARRLQAYFECLLNEEATGMAQSPLFWTMFAGSGRSLVL